MTKIQFKRGIKPNLPNLSEGEPAFTMDTKELFIGDGTANYNMTPCNNNLIVNGNFQIALTSEEESGSIVITPTNSRFIYGNFYLSTVSGSITVTRDVLSRSITLVCNDAIPKLEYRERVPAYSLPLIDKKLTLSYEANISGARLQGVQCGVPSGPKDMFDIEIGTTQVISTFMMKYTTNPYSIMDIILLETTTNFTGNINLGKFKLEVGEYPTIFRPHSILQDSSALREIYQEMYYSEKPTYIQNNTIAFCLPYYVPKWMLNNLSTNILEVLNVEFRTSTNELIQNYSYSTSFQPGVPPLFITVLGILQDMSGATDMFAYIHLAIDLRPYEAFS